MGRSVRRNRRGGGGGLAASATALGEEGRGERRSVGARRGAPTPGDFDEALLEPVLPLPAGFADTDLAAAAAFRDCGDLSISAAARVERASEAAGAGAPSTDPSGSPHSPSTAPLSHASHPFVAPPLPSQRSAAKSAEWCGLEGDPSVPLSRSDLLEIQRCLCFPSSFSPSSAPSAKGASAAAAFDARGFCSYAWVLAEQHAGDKRYDTSTPSSSSDPGTSAPSPSSSASCASSQHPYEPQDTGGIEGGEVRAAETPGGGKEPIRDGLNKFWEAVEARTAARLKALGFSSSAVATSLACCRYIRERRRRFFSSAAAPASAPSSCSAVAPSDVALARLALSVEKSFNLSIAAGRSRQARQAKKEHTLSQLRLRAAALLLSRCLEILYASASIAHDAPAASQNPEFLVRIPPAAARAVKRQTAQGARETRRENGRWSLGLADASPVSPATRLSIAELGGSAGAAAERGASHTQRGIPASAETACTRAPAAGGLRSVRGSRQATEDAARKSLGTRETERDAQTDTDKRATAGKRRESEEDAGVCTRRGTLETVAGDTPGSVAASAKWQAPDTALSGRQLAVLNAREDGLLHGGRFGRVSDTKNSTESGRHAKDARGREAQEGDWESGGREETLEALQQADIEAAHARVAATRAESEGLYAAWMSRCGPFQTKRRELPVYKHRAEFLEALDTHQVVLVSGETGCGKTTQLPQYAWEACLERRRAAASFVVMAQARRICAVSVAERIGEEMDEGGAGRTVGYQVRLEGKRGPDTRLLVCTTGVLFRMMESDRRLEDVTHLFLDEVHERSLETDMLLVLLKRILPARPTLRVVLMSASINTGAYASYFGNNICMLCVQGRTFPVSTLFLENVLHFVDDTQTQTEPPSDEKNSLTAAAEARLREHAPYANLPMPLLQRVALRTESEVNYGLIAALVAWIHDSHAMPCTGTPPASTSSRESASCAAPSLSAASSSLRLPRSAFASPSPSQPPAASAACADLPALRLVPGVCFAPSACTSPPPGLPRYAPQGGDSAQALEVRASMEAFKKSAADLFAPVCGGGAILIFLPGVYEIRHCIDALGKLGSNAEERATYPDSRRRAQRLAHKRSHSRCAHALSSPFHVVALHSRLSVEEQKRAFEAPPKGKRKIILTTNIAETSVTIDDVSFVIDSGLQRTKSFKSAARLSLFEDVWTTRANVLQRKGRAGRVAPGLYCALYSSLTFARDMQPDMVPEILRRPLEEICIQLLALRLDHPPRLFAEAMDPPDPLHVCAALQHIHTIQAVQPASAAFAQISDPILDASSASSSPSSSSSSSSLSSSSSSSPSFSCSSSSPSLPSSSSFSPRSSLTSSSHISSRSTSPEKGTAGASAPARLWMEDFVRAEKTGKEATRWAESKPTRPVGCASAAAAPQAPPPRSSKSLKNWVCLCSDALCSCGAIESHRTAVGALDALAAFLQGRGNKLAKKGARRNENYNSQRQLRAYAQEACELSPLGWQLARLPVEASIGKLLILGSLLGCQDAALTLAAILDSPGDIFATFARHPQDVAAAKRKLSDGSGGDHVARWRAVAGLEAEREKGRDAQRSFVNQFCVELSTASRALKRKRNLRTALVSAGLTDLLAPSVASKREELNLVRALVTAALYPQVAVLALPAGKSPAYTTHGSADTAKLHQQNADTGMPSIVAYQEKTTTPRTSGCPARACLRDVTRVSPLALLLLCGNLEIFWFESRVVFDDWLSIGLSPGTAALLRLVVARFALVKEMSGEAREVDAVSRAASAFVPSSFTERLEDWKERSAVLSLADSDPPELFWREVEVILSPQEMEKLCSEDESELVTDPVLASLQLGGSLAVSLGHIHGENESFLDANFSVAMPLAPEAARDRCEEKMKLPVVPLLAVTLLERLSDFWERDDRVDGATALAKTSEDEDVAFDRDCDVIDESVAVPLKRDELEGVPEVVVEGSLENFLLPSLGTDDDIPEKDDDDSLVDMLGIWVRVWKEGERFLPTSMFAARRPTPARKLLRSH
ncbi:hypothetical protein BESB_039260 [Besnoitia besnoiti]|uniref:Helicase associated domain (Ha2) protein n=1 Tax=Besnoitia besnoiti TaxID=94643 RepID=A0A2A9MG24_BESBE|nr:hypothetical protein BESB_039260 [Besnoitia besnoiti]PFH37468.1 hypothetical protein BESB_039260 [Besnoitia besnoiti]